MGEYALIGGLTILDHENHNAAYFRLPTKSTFCRAQQLGEYASHVSRLSLLVENLILPKT
jgi:hypothetical protein